MEIFCAVFNLKKYDYDCVRTCVRACVQTALQMHKNLSFHHCICIFCEVSSWEVMN